MSIFSGGKKKHLKHLKAKTLDAEQTPRHKEPRIYSDWGLTMSTEKSELLCTDGSSPPDVSVAEVDGCDHLHFVESFKYLGANISKTPGCALDVTSRIDAARKCFWSLAKPLWNVAAISISTKIRVFRSCVLSVLLYGAETWTTTFSCRRKLQSFYTKCLRKIAGFNLYKQEQWSLTDTALCSWLGVPHINHIISQARLRWLGHLARMENHRLPKQMLFAFIPGDVGIPTQVGRRTGKWLANEWLQDLRLACIPLDSWMYLARNQHGAEWHKRIFRMAPWFPPRVPVYGNAPPGRKPEDLKVPPPLIPRRSFKTHVQRFNEQHSVTDFEDGFLLMEQALGGRGQTLAYIVEILQTHLGPNWHSFEEAEWINCFFTHSVYADKLSTSVDLATLLLVLRSTVVTPAVLSSPALPTPPEPLEPKRRLTRKSARPTNMPPPPHPADITAAQLSAVVVRLSSHSYRLHEEGDFICAVCNRKFPTKGGLAKHMSLVHTEGTFREQGFQCPLCPRLFQIQRGLTMHLTHEHSPDSEAPTCPHCGSVFPGVPMLKLHLAQSHPLRDEDFPAACPLCIRQGCQTPPTLPTAHSFKIHRQRCHFHDREILPAAVEWSDPTPL